MSRPFKIILAVFAIIFVGMLILANREQDENLADLKKSMEVEQKRFKALTPEQREKELAIRARQAKEQEAANELVKKEAEQETKKADDRKQGIAAAVYAEKILRGSMKDPDTFELKDATYMDDHSACYTFRAKNSFNAMLQGNAVFEVTNKESGLYVSGTDGNKFVRAWNKHCAKKSGIDLASYIPD